MHSNQKDKKRKAKKKAKKQRKIANRTAITLTEENDQKAINAAIAKSDELWNLPIDVSEGTNMPVKYAFVEKESARVFMPLGFAREMRQKRINIECEQVGAQQLGLRNLLELVCL